MDFFVSRDGSQIYINDTGMEGMKSDQIWSFF